MAAERKRKVDRRTLYTKMEIKNAMLTLLGKKDYADITVAELCREAELNRGTFYLHYNNTAQIIDELFDDAIGNMHSVLVQLGSSAAADEKCAYPLCRFLRENKQYQPLFFSDSLHGYAVERLAQSDRDRYLSKLSETSSLSRDVLEEIFYFQLNGCLAVSRRNIGISDEDWSRIQCGVDSFLRRGFENT